LLLVAGGYIRKLIKEVKEFFDVIHLALQDKDITAKELASIIKEASDIKTVVLEIVKKVRG